MYHFCSRAVIRLILVLKYKQGLQRSNPVLPLDRRSDLICLQRNHNRTLKSNQRERSEEPVAGPSTEAVGNGTAMGAEGRSSSDTVPGTSGEKKSDQQEDSTITLKRSGRVMRTLESAPNRGQRTWSLPGVTDPRMRQLVDRTKKDAPPSDLSEIQLYGELIHILRPLAHLVSMGLFGPTAWPPYLVSLGMDVTSLKLLHEPRDKIWNLAESIELGQRSFALLLYLLRSPFYDRYTKERILRFLYFCSEKIPIFGRLIRPMVDYLPEWQKTYFYVWGGN